MLKKRLNSFQWLICLLPLVLFFSYYPVIGLGTGETMNFELSLPLIWLVVFDLVVFVMLWRKKILFAGLRGKWAWLLLPIFLTMSVFWSVNFVRGVLTVGILWLIYFAIYGMWSLRELFDEKFRRKWWKCFLGSTLVVCGWCVAQCVLDLVGVSREYTLMCAGCTYEMFGFPHPNGFAIEPQFMGNLLLAPATIAAWMFLKKRSNRKQEQNSKILERERSRGVVLTTGQADSAPNYSSGSSSVPVVKTTTGSHFLCSKILLFCFLIISATLFLTFSRGAIYAFVVGMIVMSVIAIVRVKKSEKVGEKIGVVWVAVIVAFLLALNAQGVMAGVSSIDDTYKSGVAKVLNHLSLGVIDIREKPEKTQEKKQVLESEITGVEQGEILVEKPVENFVEKKAIFDGYVAESTDTRLRLTGAALEVWSQDFTTMMFGVGLGGAGQALYNNGLSPAPKEIVQNEYASLLLETGVIGCLLLILTLILIIRLALKSLVAPMIMGLLVAYGISLLFFSGLPNALQIYLIPGVLLAMEGQTVLRKKLVS